MTIDDLLLMAYADGALKRDARRLLERRLASDEALRLRLAAVQRTTQLARLALDDSEVVLPSAKSRRAVIGECAALQPSGPRFAVAPMAVASAVLALAAGALLIWMLMNSETRQADTDRACPAIQLATPAVLCGGRMS